jgi:hypothetical protein
MGLSEEDDRTKSRLLRNYVRLLVF